MRNINRINSILLSYIELVSISNLALLCPDSYRIVSNMHNCNINVVEMEFSCINKDIEKTVNKKWNIDLLYMAPTDKDIKKILDLNLLINIKNVTRSIIFDIVFVSDVKLLIELLNLLNQAGFYASDELIFENIGACVLRQFSHNSRSSKKLLQNMCFGIRDWSAGIIDLDLSLCDDKRKILKTYDIKELREVKDWKFSLIPVIKSRNIVSWPQSEEFFIKNKFQGKISSYNIRFVLFVIVINQPEWMLNETIESINNQIYLNWEIVLLVLRSDLNRNFSKNFYNIEKSEKIKIFIINEKDEFRDKAASMLNLEDYFAIIICGDTLTESALTNIYRYVIEDKSSIFFETDVMEVAQNGRRERMRLGPSQKSITSNVDDYNLFVISSAKSLLKTLTDLKYEQKITYIPNHCYNMRTGSDMSDWQNDFIANQARSPTHQSNIIYKTMKGVDRIRWKKHNERISVIFVSHLSNSASISAAKRISSYVDYKENIEFIMASSNKSEINGSNLKFINDCDDICIVEKIKMALAISTGNIIVFIDVAYRPMFPDWINELVGPIIGLDLGIVGGKIIERNNSYSSAGLTFDMAGNISNIMETEVHRDISSDFLRCDNYRFRFAISGGAFAISKNLLNTLGGFDSIINFPRLDFDLCLRAQRKSNKILYNPYAVFWSFGPAVLSDWLDDNEWGAAWLRKNYPAGDPFSSPNIVYKNGIYCLRDPNM